MNFPTIPRVRTVPFHLSDPKPDPPRIVSGLDLGQAADWTALVVTEVTRVPDPDRPLNTVPHVAVRHLHRWPLGTGYPQIVADVKDLYSAPPLANTSLVIDRTGVGRAVYDMFSQAHIRAGLRPLTITGGQGSTVDTVAKIELVGAVQALLGNRRLKIAADLDLADTLQRELETFRVKVNIFTRNEAFEAWRERDHDDLVLALAMACWIARQAVPSVW